MGKKHNLLIINKNQFGYHTDCYKYCEYLRDDYNITFVCFDLGLKRLELDGVKVWYVPYKGKKQLRGFKFLLYSLWIISRSKGAIFVNYFERCELLPLMMPRKIMMLDIRTLSVSHNEAERARYDKALSKACYHFKLVTVISEGVREKLGLSESNSKILPLGSDVISQTNKSFETLKLLYVGTFSGRRIADTIEGLKIFIQENRDVRIDYKILGDGVESVDLKKLVEDLNLTEVVNFYGRVPHFELEKFFDEANVGVSYIPITDFFNYQPPTKTFEYILSGMPCIGTKTNENRLLINSSNGILCDDTPTSFALALKGIYDNRENFESTVIRSSLLEHTWERISSYKLKPIIEKLYYHDTILI